MASHTLPPWYVHPVSDTVNKHLDGRGTPEIKEHGANKACKHGKVGWEVLVRGEGLRTRGKSVQPNHLHIFLCPYLLRSPEQGVAGEVERGLHNEDDKGHANKTFYCGWRRLFWFFFSFPFFCSSRGG